MDTGIRPAFGPYPSKSVGGELIFLTEDEYRCIQRAIWDRRISRGDARFFVDHIFREPRYRTEKDCAKAVRILKTLKDDAD